MLSPSSVPGYAALEDVLDFGRGKRPIPAVTGSRCYVMISRARVASSPGAASAKAPDAIENQGSVLRDPYVDIVGLVIAGRGGPVRAPAEKPLERRLRLLGRVGSTMCEQPVLAVHDQVHDRVLATGREGPRIRSVACAHSLQREAREVALIGLSERVSRLMLPTRTSA